MLGYLEKFCPPSDQEVEQTYPEINQTLYCPSYPLNIYMTLIIFSILSSVVFFCGKPIKKLFFFLPVSHTSGTVKKNHNPFSGDYFTEYSIIHRLSQAQNQRLSCPTSKKYTRKIRRITVRRKTFFTCFSASFSCSEGGFQVSLEKKHFPCLDIKSTKCPGLDPLPKAHDLSRGTAR